MAISNENLPIVNIDADPRNANWLRIVGARRRKAAGNPEPQDEQLLSLDEGHEDASFPPRSFGVTSTVEERLNRVDPSRRHIAERIFDHVPKDGSSIGNITLRAATHTMSSADYRPARDELVRVKLIRLGYGRGGSVLLHDDLAQEDVAGPPPSHSGIELSLYQSVQARLLQLYDDDRGRWSEGTIVEVTGTQGGRSTGGKWTRPDITVVAHRKLRVLEGTHIEVHTYELKTISGFAIDSLHEARAHRRCAHRSYVVVDIENAEQEDKVSALTDAALDLGVGLISFAFAEADWNIWNEAPFHQPDPVDLDDFLAVQISPDHRQTIRSWKATPGLAGD